MKYHNNEHNIKEHFGYDRLGEPFKTCLKCREQRRKSGRECAQRYYDSYRDEVLEKRRTYREQHKEELQEKSKEHITCDVCGSSVRRWGLARHQRTNKCKKAVSTDN